MKHLGIVLIILFSLNCYAQQTSTDPFIGTWRGTSICQVKDSPCKNETNVYNIFAGKSKNLYLIKGSRIANGQEVEMGDLDFTYNETSKNLTCKMVDNSKRESVWTFELKEGALKGTLTHEGTLYRIIDLKKDN